MKTIRYKGEYARDYVRELGGSLEVHGPDETCSDVYFDANTDHPDHKAILLKLDVHPGLTLREWQDEE